MIKKMMEKDFKLNELANDIYLANKAKGFWDKEVHVGVKLMLIVTELAEAMEADRGRGNTLNIDQFELMVNKDPANFKEAFQLYVKDSFGDEIADALIRILDLCGGLGINIGWHVENKLKYNSTREKMHGKVY